MRHMFLVLPLLAIAAPAVAQAQPQPEAIQIPPELTDPATAAKLANMAKAMSDAFLDLPVGEIQAAAEGRKPTAREERMTVRDMGRRDNPNFDRDINRQMAQAGPMIQQSMNAFAQALPAMNQALSQIAVAVERAAANMPRPLPNP
ncbi:MAG TPA: hypothetical protein VFS69_03255 [Sphingomicrobium sp.]|jgi:hypothetical protein|nr:hypothetical protein [Sphingomicrobium sp.]